MSNSASRSWYSLTLARDSTNAISEMVQVVGSSRNGVITIYDMDGRELQRYHAQEERTSLVSLGALPPGPYVFIYRDAARVSRHILARM